MSSLAPSNLSFRQTILITALAASLGTTAAVLSFQALRREHRTEKLKKQVGEDVDEWERSREGTGLVSPEERVERWAEGEEVKGGGRRMKEWGEGEFDEGLIREQVRRLFSLLRLPQATLKSAWIVCYEADMQLTRNYNFLGEESMTKIRKSYVVVVGCGGVGSWCSLMLLRR